MGGEDALNGQQRYQEKLRVLKTEDDLKKKKRTKVEIGEVGWQE